jgi:antitoxin VapB
MGGLYFTRSRIFNTHDFPFNDNPLFQNGRSQAVRIPKEFRFRGNEVKISKKGDKVILEPLERSRWPEGFWDAFPVDQDFKTPEALPSKNFSLD